MSRKIKVRLYSKPAKKYIDYITVGFLNTGELRSYSTENGFGPVLEDNYIVEQYTGIKDKNGKEIYAGDIVNLAYYKKPHGKKRWVKNYPHKDINVVEFEDGYFKFSNTDKYGIGSELVFSDYGEWSGRDCEYKYEAEVIGNIHENPELLEDK